MRGVFGSPPWLKTSERAISFTIWGVLILRYVGLLPQILDELEAIEIPLGKHGISLLAIGTGALVIMLTVTVSLWLSSLIERRLLRGGGGLDSNLRVVMAKAVRALLLVFARADRAAGGRHRPHAAVGVRRRARRRASGSACRSSPAITSPDSRY